LINVILNVISVFQVYLLTMLIVDIVEGLM